MRTASRRAQQIFWAVCFYDRLVVPAGIDCHVMFLNGIDSRLYTDSFINLTRKLLPSICAKDIPEFFF